MLRATATPTKKIIAVPVGGGMSEIVEVPYIEHYPPDVSPRSDTFLEQSRARRNGGSAPRSEASSSEVVVRVVGGLPLPDDEPEDTSG